MIIDLAKENGYFECVLDNLKYRLEKSNDKWCIMIGHPSGRDFYTERPIEFMSDEEIDKLKAEVLEDTESEYTAEDFATAFETAFGNTEAIEELEYDGFTSIPEDKDEFFEYIREYVDNNVFQMAFDVLLEEND